MCSLPVSPSLPLFSALITVAAQTVRYAVISSRQNSSSMPVAIITGSSSGIGRESAILFAKNGWQVVVTGRNAQNLNETVKECVQAGAKESDIATVLGDITSLSVAEQLVKAATDKFGHLDCLVNNAGFGVPKAPFAVAPIENYDKVFETNVRSVIQLTKLAIPHLIASKGNIVNISSAVALVSLPTAGYYSMSKAALDQFTKILSLEMAPHGVRVNSVNPAMIETNFFTTMGLTPDEYKAFAENAKKVHALGRPGRPDEVAKAIFWLAGPDSSFTTGETLKIDGGFVLVRP